MPFQRRINKQKCVICKERPATHRILDKGGPTHCTHENCKVEGMKYVKQRFCIECNKTQSSYNLPGLIHEYCKSCAKPNMINVTSVKCIVCKETEASFNYEGQPAKYCGKNSCKKEGMICLKKRKPCIKCNKEPSFYNFDGLKAEFCKTCKEPNMINVVKKKCIICQKVSASYNYEGKSPMYCASLNCRKQDMVDVRTGKKCAKCQKYKICSYNYPGQPKIFCGDCKLEGMINQNKHRLCIKCNKNRARYNYIGLKPKYCRSLECRTKDMINVTTSKCYCGIEASIGYPQTKVSHCASHKLPGMIFEPNRRCKHQVIGEDKCKEYAIYGYGTHIACEKHKKDDMINFVEKQCSSCGLIQVLSEDSNKCKACDTVFKDKVNKVKEMEVKNFLDSNHYNYISHDKKIPYTDLLSRPDFLFYGKDEKYFVILEVDEYQHEYKEQMCERIRMINISQVLGKPTIFIRYNPDRFTVDNEVHNLSQGKRRIVLSKWLNKLLNLDFLDVYCNYGFLSYIKLFYDEYDEYSQCTPSNIEQNEYFETISPYEGQNMLKANYTIIKEFLASKTF